MSYSELARSALLVLPMILGASAGLAQDSFRWVAREPSTFPILSPAVAEYLHQRHCLVPVAPEFDHPHNAVRGELERHGQVDIAVLCLRNDTSTIFVFWASATTRVDSLESHRHDSGRWIGVATPKYIRDHANFYGWPAQMPHRVTHDGVEDGSGCCSTVFYHHRGRWIETPGAD
jgi:hypothetical protein